MGKSVDQNLKEYDRKASCHRYTMSYVEEEEGLNLAELPGLSGGLGYRI